MIVTETQRILFGGRAERDSAARQGKRRAALGWPLRLSIKGEPSGCPSLRTPRLSGREEVRGRVRFPPSPPPDSEVFSDLSRAAVTGF